MFNSSDEYKQFVTLLAHDSRSGLQIQHFQDIYGSALVLTGSQLETATAIANKLFNLIIVDLDLNGLDLISLAKSTGSINYHTPIIALIARDDPSLRKNSIAAGFDDCLVQPLTASNLHETIKVWRENDVLTSSTNAIQALLAKTKHNHALVLVLFNKLFEELPQQIDQIEFALKTAQYQLAFEVTHKLNGAAIICCLDHIGVAATALEKGLIQKEYEYNGDHFLILKKRISLFLNHRQAILDELGRLNDKQ